MRINKPTSIGLVLPDTCYLESYLAALREGYRHGSGKVRTEEEIRAIERNPFRHFDELNYQGGMFLCEDGVARTRVPHAYYWLVDGGEFIGTVWIRFALNDFIEKYIGHVGYGIRPSRQRKGYAKKILAFALDKLKERGITRVLVTANEENIASWKVIEANGGVLENKVVADCWDGVLKRRYWIDLSGACQ